MRDKNKGTRLSLLLLIISLSLIGSGIYIGYLSNPKRIVVVAVQNLSNSFKPKSTSNKITFIKPNEKESDGITINSKIKLIANSHYIIDKASIDPNYIQYANFLKNITATDTTINFSKDNKNKKLLLNIKSNLNNEPLIDSKYLIQDATTYYYSNHLNENYINSGSNGYFENKSDTTIENLKNLYTNFLSSIKDNLKKEYFTVSEEKTTISQEKEQTLKKVSLEIDNKIEQEILENVFSDLKENKTLNEVLTNKNNNLKNINITKNKKILSENEKIILNVYTDKITYKIRKYELILKNDKSNIKVVYEESNNGYIQKNNKLLYKYTVTTNTSGTKINITSIENKYIGSIILEKTPNYYETTININTGKTNIVGSHKKEYTTIKEDYSYSIMERFDLRVTNKKFELININYLKDTSLEYQSNIKEDVSNSIFKSSITNLEENQFSNLHTSIINKLFQ